MSHQERRSANLSGSVLMCLIPTLSDIPGLQLFDPTSHTPQPSAGISDGNTGCGVAADASPRLSPGSEVTGHHFQHWQENRMFAPTVELRGSPSQRRSLLPAHGTSRLLTEERAAPQPARGHEELPSLSITRQTWHSSTEKPFRGKEANLPPEGFQG